MDAKTLYKEMQVLKQAFDIVRLVDVTRTLVIDVSEDGELSEAEYICYAVWNKTQRCENCISAKAYAEQGELTKFEFLDDKICFVMARYVTVNDKAYILEMVKIMDDKTLLGAFGKSAFIDGINAYNSKLYTDSLTGAYNRRYFDEQLSGLRNISAIATLDIDNFKDVNDSYGHEAGDAALKAFAEALTSSVRAADAVIRLGGDEFVIVFQGVPQKHLFDKLEFLRKKVEALEIPGYSELKITTSIGGFYCAEFVGDSFKISDDKLYEAKKLKNTVVV